MELASLGIPIVLTILVSLILYFIIGGKGHWLLKLTIIIWSSWVGFIVWNALDSYGGYPTQSPLPEKFLINWVIIEEENNQTGNPGAIYLWISSLTKEKKGILDYESIEPRTHRIPYSRETHKLMDEIIKRLTKGEIVIGNKQGGKESKKGSGNGKGNSKGTGRGNSMGDMNDSTGKNGVEGKGFGSFSISDQGYNLGPIPPPVYPEK